MEITTAKNTNKKQENTGYKTTNFMYVVCMYIDFKLALTLILTMHTHIVCMHVCKDSLTHTDSQRELELVCLLTILWITFSLVFSKYCYLELCVPVHVSLAMLFMCMYIDLVCISVSF